MSSKSSRSARVASRINRRPHSPAPVAAAAPQTAKRSTDTAKVSASKRLITESERLAEVVVEQSVIAHLNQLVVEMDQTQDLVDQLFSKLLRSRSHEYDSSKCHQAQYNKAPIELDAAAPRLAQLNHLFGRCEELHAEMKDQLSELDEHTKLVPAHRTLQSINRGLYDLKHQIEQAVENYAEPNDWCRPRLVTLRQRAHLLSGRPYYAASYEERRQLASKIRADQAPATLIHEGETLVLHMPLSLESPARGLVKLMRSVEKPNAYLCVVASDDQPISPNGYGYASAVLVLADSEDEVPLGQVIGSTAFLGQSVYRPRIAALRHRLVSPQTVNSRRVQREDKSRVDPAYPENNHFFVRSTDHHSVFVNGRLLELLRTGRVPADFDLALDYVRREVLTPSADPVLYELDSKVAFAAATSSPVI